MAAVPHWEPAIPGVPPGGFATVTVEGVHHGDRHVPSDVKLRVRADKERTTILVKLDGNYLTQSGRPFKSMTDNPADLPHWNFVETQVFDVPVSGLAPGVHQLQIRRGIKGSSLTLTRDPPGMRLHPATRASPLSTVFRDRPVRTSSSAGLAAGCRRMAMAFR